MQPCSREKIVNLAVAVGEIERGTLADLSSPNVLGMGRTWPSEVVVVKDGQGMGIVTPEFIMLALYKMTCPSRTPRSRNIMVREIADVAWVTSHADEN